MLVPPRPGRYEYRLRRTGEPACDIEVVEVADVDQGTSTFTTTTLVTGSHPQRKSLLCEVDGTRLLRLRAWTELPGDDEPGHVIAAALTPAVVVLDLAWPVGHCATQRWRLDGEFLADEMETTVRYAGPSVCTDAAGRRHRVVRTSMEERSLVSDAVNTVDTWFSPALGVAVETRSTVKANEGGVDLHWSQTSTLLGTP